MDGIWHNYRAAQPVDELADQRVLLARMQRAIAIMAADCACPGTLEKVLERLAAQSRRQDFAPPI